MLRPRDIVEVAQSLGSFSQLLTTATALNLVTALQGAGPMTVLAPVDAAFTAIADTLETLTDTQKTNIILGHVITGAGVRSGALSNGQVVTTAANTDSGASASTTIPLVAGSSVMPW